MHPRHAHHTKRIDRNCSSTFTEVIRKIQITRKFSSICTRPSRSNVVYNSRDLQSRTKPASQALHPNGKSVQFARPWKKQIGKTATTVGCNFSVILAATVTTPCKKIAACKKNCFQSLQHLTRGGKRACTPAGFRVFNKRQKPIATKNNWHFLKPPRHTQNPSTAEKKKKKEKKEGACFFFPFILFSRTQFSWTSFFASSGQLSCRWSVLP